MSFDDLQPLEKIKAILALKRWPKSALSSAIGTNPGHISNILNGRNNPNQNTRERIAAALDVDPAWLWGDMPLPKISGAGITERGRRKRTYARLARMEGHTHQRIGDALGISQQRAHQMVNGKGHS